MPDRAPPQAGWVPVPDPTKLTTDAVASAKADIEKLFDVKLDGLRELFGEKFQGIKTEFAMRDTALAAALKAAQEAVKQQNESNTLAIDKAGTATTKQIDSLVERIDDLKERIQVDRGTKSQGVGLTVGVMVQIVATIASVGAIVSVGLLLAKGST